MPARSAKLERRRQRGVRDRRRTLAAQALEGSTGGLARRFDARRLTLLREKLLLRCNSARDARDEVWSLGAAFDIDRATKGGTVILDERRGRHFAAVRRAVQLVQPASC